MNKPLDFPFRAQQHIATLAALKPDEAGSWIKLVAHCWYTGPLTIDLALRLVDGEENFDKIRFLLEMRDNHFTFPWLEEERARKERQSKRNSINGRKGGRGNKRGNRHRHAAAPAPPLPAPPRVHAPVPPAPAPPKEASAPTLFPAERFTWPKWAGAKVKAKWQEFKLSRWENHKAEYKSINAEQSAIDLLDRYYTKGADCYDALQVAVAKQWKNLVDPADLAPKGAPKPAEAPKPGEVNPAKVKPWLVN